MMKKMLSSLLVVLCSLATTLGNTNMDRHQVELFEHPQTNQDGQNQVEINLLDYQNNPPSLTESRKVTLCNERRNCSFCTSSQVCSWCESTKNCFPYFGASNASRVCTLWYKDQCLYSTTTKPCPQRHSGGCKGCLSDKLCYWCKSTGNCSYYPYDAFTHPDCPSDSVYYDSCSKTKFWVVMAPILAMLLAPVAIFIVLGIILCCMKQMGIKVEDDDEKEEAPKDSPKPEKEKPSMKLSHQPAQSRIEELRKKYNLGE